MAEKRMFSSSLVDSDEFNSMSLSAQALYFRLALEADDEGFVDKPKSIMRKIGANEDDLRILLMKRYVLGFPSGIIVIKHWLLHNYIRGDRIRETKYIEEKSMLVKKKDGTYTEKERHPELVADKRQAIDGQMSVKCQSNVSQVTDKCQASIEERSIEENSKENTLVRAILLLPTKTDPFEITQDYVNELQEVYSTNVLNELKKMKIWLEANPVRLKTYGGMKKFIVGWLNRVKEPEKKPELEVTYEKQEGNADVEALLKEVEERRARRKEHGGR